MGEVSGVRRVEMVWREVEKVVRVWSRSEREE